MTQIIAPNASAKDKMVAVFELYTFWNTTVPIPSSFEVVRSSWSIPEKPVRGGHRPLAVVTLPNGATVKVELTDPFDTDSREETYSGGWNAYTGGDIELRDALSDVMHRVFLTLIRENKD